MVRGRLPLVLAFVLCGTAQAPRIGAAQERAAADARGWLGVRIEQRYDCSWDTAEDWTNCELVARVTGLEEGGPASRGGLRVGDRVVALDGLELTLESMAGALADIRPGALVRVEVTRDGERHGFGVIPGARPSDPVGVPMSGRPSGVAPAGAGEARVFVLKRPDPVGNDAAGYALTVRATEDEGLAVEPSAVRVVGGRLEVLLTRERPVPEAQELRALLGSLERERESAYREVSRTLQRVRQVRERVPVIEFRRGMARLAEERLAAPRLAIRFNRTFAGAEFESVRDFSGRTGLDGLLVLRVVPGTITARLGLRAGDLLVRAGEEPTPELEDFIAAIDAAGGDGPTVEWIREGRELRRVAWPGR